MKKLLLSIALVACVVTEAKSQKILLVSGDPTVLKGQTEVNLVYDYSALEVGKFPSEQSYKDKKVAEYNKKEAGRGDKWVESWERDKTVRYPEKFEELINKGLSGNGIHFAQNNEAAKYTLIVKTKFIEPGYNVGISSMPAAANFEYMIVEKDKPTNFLAHFSHKGVPGAQAFGMDFDTGTRISESYAKGGKMLAAFIAKKLK